jgi:hypothetical protein
LAIFVAFNQEILQKLEALGKQISALQALVSAGFSQINAKLDRILLTLSAEFGRIESGCY